MKKLILDSKCSEECIYVLPYGCANLFFLFCCLCTTFLRSSTSDMVSDSKFYLVSASRVLYFDFPRSFHNNWEKRKKRTLNDF